MQQRGHQGTASGVWKAVSAFLTWCVQNGLLEVNPVLGAPPEFDIKIGTRVLSMDEISAYGWPLIPLILFVVRLSDCSYFCPFVRPNSRARVGVNMTVIIFIFQLRELRLKSISLSFSDFAKSCLACSTE